MHCNCESAFCGHHGGNLANGRGLASGEYPRCESCPNPADPNLVMTFVGPVCAECARVNPDIILPSPDQCPHDHACPTTGGTVCLDCGQKGV